jgi:restriction endonuclease S subunit
MGSFIEINDTLRISRDQGFPKDLDIFKHMENPYRLEDFTNKVFKFKNKPDIRVYKIPPARNFLVEEIDGKWLYWGRCHILSIEHDYVNKTTSGTFKIIYINTPDEMHQAFRLTDGREELNFFK